MTCRLASFKVLCRFWGVHNYPSLSNQHGKYFLMDVITKTTKKSKLELFGHGKWTPKEMHWNLRTHRPATACAKLLPNTTAFRFCSRDHGNHAHLCWSVESAVCEVFGPHLYPANWRGYNFRIQIASCSGYFPHWKSQLQPSHVLDDGARGSF